MRESDFGPKLASLFSGWLIVSEFPIGQDDYYALSLSYGGHVLYPKTRIDWVVFREDRAYAIQAKLKWNKALINQAIIANAAFPLVYLLVPAPPTERFAREYGLNAELQHLGIIAQRENGQLYIIRKPTFHFSGYSEHAYWKRVYPHLYNELYRWLMWQKEKHPPCRYKWPLNNSYVCPFLRQDGTCAWEYPPAGIFGGCEIRNHILGDNVHDDLSCLIEAYVNTSRYHRRPVEIVFDEQSWTRFRKMKKLRELFALIYHLAEAIEKGSEHEDSD